MESLAKNGKPLFKRKRWIYACVALLFGGGLLWHYTFFFQHIFYVGFTLWHKGFTEAAYTNIRSFNRGFVLSLTPVPSDEEMIDHFNQHRADFERYVDGFRSLHARGQTREWEKTEPVASLKRRANISWLSTLSMGYWIDDPYSVDGFERSKKIFQTSTLAENEARYSAIAVSLNDDRFHSIKRKYGHVWKTYLHFPQAPKIDKGSLVIPPGPIHPSYIGKSYFVVDSLNHYPENWDGRCHLRRLDSQWFIELCAAYH